MDNEENSNQMADSLYIWIGKRILAEVVEYTKKISNMWYIFIENMNYIIISEQKMPQNTESIEE